MTDTLCVHGPPRHSLQYLLSEQEELLPLRLSGDPLMLWDHVVTGSLEFVVPHIRLCHLESVSLLWVIKLGVWF